MLNVNLYRKIKPLSRDCELYKVKKRKVLGILKDDRIATLKQFLCKPPEIESKRVDEVRRIEQDVYQKRQVKILRKILLRGLLEKDAP